LFWIVYLFVVYYFRLNYIHDLDREACSRLLETALVCTHSASSSIAPILESLALFLIADPRACVAPKLFENLSYPNQRTKAAFLKFDSDSEDPSEAVYTQFFDKFKTMLQLIEKAEELRQDRPAWQEWHKSRILAQKVPLNSQLFNFELF
jgi:hypothetical protein